MSVNLNKGGVVNLTKEAPQLSNILVGLGWDEASKSKGFFSRLKTLDLDASAIILRDGVLESDDDIVYFGNLKSSDGAVKHHGDNLTGAGSGDDERITIKLKKLDSDVNKIVFVVNIYNAVMKRQSFEDVRNAFIRMVDKKTDKELCRFDISQGGVGHYSALVFAELYRDGDNWSFKAIGEGSPAKSLADLVDRYRG